MAEMLENIDWDQLLTKPMSEAELAQYQSVLGSDAFQDVVRSYHASAALQAIRHLVLEFCKAGVSLEAMITALANVWIDSMVRVESRMDAESQRNWRSQPQLLVQILFQQAVVAMQENEAQLERGVPPELREQAAEWSKALPEPLGELQEGDPALDLQLKNLEHSYQYLTELRKQLEASELKLEANDYLEVWTQVLLQAFIYGQLKQPELYFTIDTNWDLFLDRLASIVSLMFLLKNEEYLLLPENRLRLAAHVQTPEFNRLVERYLE